MFLESRESWREAGRWKEEFGFRHVLFKVLKECRNKHVLSKPEFQVGGGVFRTLVCFGLIVELGLICAV